MQYFFLKKLQVPDCQFTGKLGLVKFSKKILVEIFLSPSLPVYWQTDTCKIFRKKLFHFFNQKRTPLRRGHPPESPIVVRVRVSLRRSSARRTRPRSRPLVLRESVSSSSRPLVLRESVSSSSRPLVLANSVTSCGRRLVLGAAARDL